VAAAGRLTLRGRSGKTSICLRFCKDDFDDYRESTIGAAFLSQTVQLEDGRSIKFEVRAFRRCRARLTARRYGTRQGRSGTSRWREWARLSPDHV
jgi:hypothetical protein